MTWSGGIALINDVAADDWTWRCDYCDRAARRTWETKCEAVWAQMSHIRRFHREWLA